MDLAEVFLPYELESNPSASALAGAAERAACLTAWLEVERDRLTDPAFAEGFAAACPVAGASPADYAPRVLAGRPTLLAGIRFKGGDVTHPFVELIARDEPLAGRAAWDAALDRVFTEFAVFSPRSVRVRCPASERPELPAARLACDQVLCAGRLDALRARPQPGREAQAARLGGTLSIVPGRDLGWYDELAAAYASWASTAGALAAEVQVADREALQACLDSGAVVCAQVDGRWAGVAAATREDERLLGGFCVVEEFLAPPLGGRGLAATLQRALIDELPARAGDTLWGTIHGRNTPSRRTAERCGREVVETWWFVGR